jgi:hypothetical protein
VPSFCTLKVSLLYKSLSKLPNNEASEYINREKGKGDEAEREKSEMNKKFVDDILK